MADMTPQGTQDYAVESGYESGDANVKAVVGGLLVILASTLVVMAAMFGMFNYLNRQANEAASRVPVALTERIVPPEPRLLPLPYTDEQSEANALGAYSPDVLPWDKRNLEIVKQYDEANSYARYKGEEGRTAIRIPIARAIELEAGAKDGGTPAVMTWQPEYPRLTAGERAMGGGAHATAGHEGEPHAGGTGAKNANTMNLTPSDDKGTDEKNVEPSIFDRRADWETQDEKFNSESSGGMLLKPGQLSR